MPLTKVDPEVLLLSEPLHVLVIQLFSNLAYKILKLFSQRKLGKGAEKKNRISYGLLPNPPPDPPPPVWSFYG